MKTIKPADGQLFCKPFKLDKKSTSGIILLDSKEKSFLAEVINSNGDYISGDLLVYSPYSCTELKLDNEEYLIIACSDVLGKVLEV